MVDQIVTSPSLPGGAALLSPRQTQRSTAQPNSQSCLKVRGRYLRQEDRGAHHTARPPRSSTTQNPSQPPQTASSSVLRKGQALEPERTASPYVFPQNGQDGADSSPYRLPSCTTPASNPADWVKLYPTAQYAQLLDLKADIDALWTQVQAPTRHSSATLINSGFDHKKTHPAEEGYRPTVI